MSKTKQWGTPMWNFLHTFVANINEVFFLKNRSDIFEIFHLIIDTIPCDYCKTHAQDYVKKHPFHRMQSKIHCIKYFIDFHNDVNKRLNKSIFEDVHIYTSYDIRNITITFYNMVGIRRNSSKHMLDAQYRKASLKKVFDFVRTNIHYFQLPM